MAMKRHEGLLADGVTVRLSLLRCPLSFATIMAANGADG